MKRLVICQYSRVLLIFVLPAIVLACGENGQQPKTFDVAASGDLMVKHLTKLNSADQWKGEAWVEGSDSPPWYPVDIWVRLTPDDPKVAKAPKANVHAKLILIKEKKQVREGKIDPSWNECAKMKKRQEVTYDFKTRTWGPRVDFPPQISCWETTIKDPFKSDRRSKGTTPLEKGDYSIEIAVNIEGGPTLKFDLQPMTINDRR